MVQATDASGRSEGTVTQVSTGVRLAWGVLTGGILLVCWRVVAGHWPELDSSWWYWLLCAIVAIVAFWWSPVVVVFWRCTRAVERATSPSFADRLAQKGFWTEVEHVPDAGATEIMRLEDDNFVILSAGLATVKVFVTPRLDQGGAWRELATFGFADVAQRVGMTRQQRRLDDERALEHLRKAIAWPKSVAELSQRVQERHELLL